MSTASAPIPRGAGRLRRVSSPGLALLLLIVLFVAGYWPRYSARERLARKSSAAERRVPEVRVTTAVAVPGGRTLTLPGNLVAFQQALVDARASGYVARWRADIGDRVRTGDVLAELDTPELNQQLEQARATLKQKDAALEQALANRNYARIAAGRQDVLLAQSLISKQDDDQANQQLEVSEANVHAAQADIGAAQANVRRLVQLVGFGRVVAPFAGRITQRNIDVGSLVTAGTAAGATGGQPLFRIEAIDPIRVFIQVPQAFALSVKQGEAARVSLREFPGREFAGRVVRTAGTIDPASRTLNVELDVANLTGELLSGMFAQVAIAVAVSHPVVRVPASAVITDAHGIHVATLDGNGEAHLVPVVLGLDNGREIDLVEGLEGGEQVIVDPGADVTDGMRFEALKGP